MVINRSDRPKLNSNFGSGKHSKTYENYKIYISVLLLIVMYSTIFVFLNLLTPYDTALLLEINQYRIAAIESFFVLWTNGGTYLFMSLIVIVLWLKGEKKLAIYLALGLIVDALLVSDLKIMIHRPRPYEVLPIMPLELAENLRSLPSGHTATAFLSATILSRFYSKYMVVLFVIAASIGFSRVYIGVHYPLDVIVGAITGCMVGIIVVDLLDRVRVKKRY
jgi:undecaprenyl-diphosphatase